jgi:hypothetical protein
MDLNKEISEISLCSDGKLKCLFNPNDPIYTLQEAVTLPSEDEKQKIFKLAY